MVVECVDSLIIGQFTNEVLGPPQVHSTSKKLLYQLDHLVQICNQPGMEHTARKHVGKSFCLFYWYEKIIVHKTLTCIIMFIGPTA
jgi:hypothetical protein